MHKKNQIGHTAPFPPGSEVLAGGPGCKIVQRSQAQNKAKEL